jgi:cytochrome c oxidase cbb3-type subunit II
MFAWLNHGIIERNVILMGVLTLITVSIGGLAQIVPLFTVETTIERVQGMRPYTPLELRGATSTSARAATPATAR